MYAFETRYISGRRSDALIPFEKRRRFSVSCDRRHRTDNLRDVLTNGADSAAVISSVFSEVEDTSALVREMFETADHI